MELKFCFMPRNAINFIQAEYDIMHPILGTGFIFLLFVLDTAQIHRGFMLHEFAKNFFIITSRKNSKNILKGCFMGSGTFAGLLQYPLSNLEGYG